MPENIPTFIKLLDNQTFKVLEILEGLIKATSSEMTSENEGREMRKPDSDQGLCSSWSSPPPLDHEGVTRTRYFHILPFVMIQPGELHDHVRLLQLQIAPTVFLLMS